MLRIVFFAMFICVAQILWANPYSDGMDRAEIEAWINEKVAPLGIKPWFTFQNIADFLPALCGHRSLR